MSGFLMKIVFKMKAYSYTEILASSGNMRDFFGKTELATALEARREGLTIAKLESECVSTVEWYSLKFYI